MCLNCSCFLFFSENDFLPNIQYLTNTKEVLYNKNVTIFCVSKGRSDTINLFNRSGKHFYLVAKGQGYIKKTTQLTESSTYVCEIEASGIRAKEEFSIRVVGMSLLFKFLVDNFQNLANKLLNLVFIFILDT